MSDIGMDPVTPYPFDETPTPLDIPIIPPTVAVSVTGALALLIRDAVRSKRQFRWVDESHHGAHFPWSAGEVDAFTSWAESVTPDFSIHAWQLVVRSIAEDATNQACPCRITGVLSRPG